MAKIDIKRGETRELRPESVKPRAGLKAAPGGAKDLKAAEPATRRTLKRDGFVKLEGQRALKKAVAELAANPEALHRSTWTKLGDYLDANKLSHLTVSLFHKGKPGEGQEFQGPIGDCYRLSTDAALAHDDAKLFKSLIRRVGTMPDGTGIYGVIRFAEKDSAHARHFPRAADDVRYEVELPDPADPTKTKRFTRESTPVWVLVTDEVPVSHDGTLDGADIHLPGQGIVLAGMLSEKADAKFHGSYRDLNNGGDAATVMQERTGVPAVTIDVKRHRDPKKDLELAALQAFLILQHHDAGGSFVLGTWGNASIRKNQSVVDNDSIKRVIAEFPQYNTRGEALPLGEGFFHRNFEYLDGAGDADHGAAGASTDRDGKNAVGDHDFSGHGMWLKTLEKVKSAAELTRAKLAQLVVAFRNPWGSVRPDQFSDGKVRDDGILEGGWLQLRTIVGSISLGGRLKTERAPLTGLIAPELPPGAKSTFALQDGETRADEPARARRP